MSARIWPFVLLGCALFSAPAQANGASSRGLSISVNVPTVCDIEAQQFVVDQPSGRFFGQVEEFCNSNRGFQIIASHRQLATAERVSVSYDGTQSDLSASGFSPIAFRSGARFRSVNVLIDSTNLQSPLAVEFGLTAI